MAVPVTPFRTFRWLSLRLCLLGTILLGTLSGQSGAPSLLPASPYGVNAHTPEGWALEPILEKVAGAGIEWIRIDVSWATIEPSRGASDWSALDSLVAAAGARGLQIYGSIGSTPGWATDGPADAGVPRDPAEWSGFCARAASRYRGAIRVWGLWNEPNLSGFWAGSRQQYIDIILKGGADAIHGADPLARVAGPELAHLRAGGALWYRWLTDVILQAGDRLDVVTHHVYDTTGSAGVTARLDVATPFGQSPALWDTVAPSVKEVLQYTHWYGRPFWLTETGWATNNLGENFQGTNATRLLSDWFTGAPGRGWIGKIFFYELVDDGSAGIDKFGLLHNDLSSKAGYEAYRSFIATHPQGIREGAPLVPVRSAAASRIR